MEENEVREVLEKELAALLESMPGNMVIRVEFGEAGTDGKRK